MRIQHYLQLLAAVTLVLASGQATAQIPADMPPLLTNIDLRQPNGRLVNAHLVNFSTIGIYMLNRYLNRRNHLTNDQQRAEEIERKAITARHRSPASPLAASGADAERLAHLLGYASANERQALTRLLGV